MSVAIPVIDHVDPDLRRIYLKLGVRAIHMIDDIYFEMRNLRRTDESLRGWYPFVEAGGNVQKTATTYTPRYLTFLTDPRPITTKIVPADEVHTLVVTGEGITDQGTAGATTFDKTGLVNPVDIEFEPPGAEIIRLDQALIEFASFAGHVHVDLVNGIPGTGYDGSGHPIGSPLAKSNNWADAHMISVTRGITAFLIYNSTTIAGQNFAPHSHKFIGISPFIIATLDPTSDFTGCDFENLTLLGQMDGVNVIRGCSIGPVTDCSGFFEKCAFWGTVDFSGDTTIMECYSQVVGNGTATFYPGEWDLIIRDFHGSIAVDNTEAGHISSLEVYGGRITIGAVTEGEFHLRGEPYEFTSAASGNATVACECEGELTRDLYKLQGLRADSPLTVTPTSRVAGDISQVITGDGSTTTTVTRT